MQQTSWDEPAIALRGEALSKVTLQIWPGPV
jgi:hypothetical protein